MSIKDKLQERPKLKKGLKLIGSFLAFYIIIFIAICVFLRIYTHHGKSISVPDFKGLMPTRAAEIAKHEDLQLKIIDSTFIDYMPKGCIVDQNPRPGTHVKQDRTIFLTTNAYNRTKVEVPQIVGLSYRQGKATIEMQGLRIGKLIYKADFAKNNILQQLYKGEPIKAGTKIEKGEAIDIVLGNGNSSNITIIPNLEGKTFYEAVNELNNAYLNVGEVYYDNASTFNDSINATVYKQSPAYDASGNRAALGSHINIWLSIDSNSSVIDSEGIDLND